MVNEEPKVADFGRYNVTETCTKLGICRSTLHRYGKLGKIRFGIRRANMRKFYEGREIKRFWRAYL